MILVDSCTYHSSRVSQGLENAQAPTSSVLVVFSLFPLGLGRGLRTRGTTLSVIVSQKLIPVFGSEPVVLRESPCPLVRWRTWAIPWAVLRSPGREPGSSKPPRFAYCAGGPCCTVAPHSCTTSYSRERRICPTDIKQNLPPGSALRLPSRPSLARRQKGSESDR